MSFATDLASLKAAINSFSDLIKNKFLTMIPASDKGALNGIAPLVNGLVPAQYLPSFVDDVLEFNGVANFPAVGESGKVYIDSSDVNLPAYRWSGSGYFQINNHVGNADVATKLATARTISASGDASWSVNFDGSGNASAVLTLANIVTAGSAAKVTYNAKGQVTGSTALLASDIPNLDWSKINTGKPTTLGGYGIVMTSADVTSALGFTPVIQGGASHDGSSIVRIGWNVTNLVLQVNGNNYFKTWPIDISGNAANATLAATATTANSTAVNNSFQMGSLGVGTPASGTNGEIRATNNITGYYSDERLKQRVGGIDNALEKLKQLTCFLYVENDLARSFGFTSGRTMVGMSAQEIQKVQPEAVFPAPFDIAQLEDGTEVSKSGDNYLTVQYERLMPLVIEAIKELNEEVQAIKKSLG